MKGTTMAKKTITEAPVDTGEDAQANGSPVDDQTQETSLPEPADQTTAAPDTVTEETAEESEAGAEALPAEDDEKLQKFANSHGIELDSPSAIKAAKIAMDNQAEFQRNRQKASELEKSLTTTSDEVAEQEAEATGQDPELLKRLQRVEVKEAVRDFWSENPEARQYEATMIEILEKKPHLAGDLESLYANALRNNSDAVKSQGKREALESLAHKQQAAVPAGSATNSGVTPKAKPFGELSIEEMEAKLGYVRR